MSDLVWIRNPSGAVHQVDAVFAKKAITGGANAPDDYDNGGLEIISEGEAHKLLGIKPEPKAPAKADKPKADEE